MLTDHIITLDESQAHLTNRLTADQSVVYSENVTVRVSLRRNPHKEPRPQGHPPSTLLFLPIQLSNSKPTRGPGKQSIPQNSSQANKPKPKFRRRSNVPTNRSQATNLRSKTKKRPHPPLTRSAAVDECLIRRQVRPVNAVLKNFRTFVVSLQKPLLSLRHASG
jgi:hypothetical protein